MEFVADTVTLVRFFSRIGRIGESAHILLRAADQGEHSIAVSAFSLIEVLYLSEKRRIPINLEQLTSRIASLDNYRIIDLDLNIANEARNTQGLELHDRLIVATARELGVPLLTPDEAITKSGLVEVIWK